MNHTRGTKVRVIREHRRDVLLAQLTHRPRVMNANNAMTMKTLRFGVEIETTRLSRQHLAVAIQRATGGSVGVGSSSATVQMADGRVWNIVPDGSLNGSVNGEIVSPILTYADLDMLQNVVREVRKAGAVADDSCGLHVHTSSEDLDPRGIARLIKMQHKHELIIEQALGVSPDRLARFCKRVDPEVLRRVEAIRPTTVAQLKRAWYGDENTVPQRYSPTRYRALNCNGWLVRGAVEYRAFNGTLHAGEVKAAVQFALAFTAKAITAKSVSSKKRPYNPASGRYDARTLLLAIGLIGPECRTVRHHFTKRLGGSSAWKNGRPAPAAMPTTTEVA